MTHKLQYQCGTVDDESMARFFERLPSVMDRDREEDAYVGCKGYIHRDSVGFHSQVRSEEPECCGGEE